MHFKLSKKKNRRTLKYKSKGTLRWSQYLEWDIFSSLLFVSKQFEMNLYYRAYFDILVQWNAKIRTSLDFGQATIVGYQIWFEPKKRQNTNNFVRISDVRLNDLTLIPTFGSQTDHKSRPFYTYNFFIQNGLD